MPRHPPSGPRRRSNSLFVKQHFRAFYGYVASGDFSAPPPFATFLDGHREVLLCEAVLESHRKGGWVKVPPLSPDATRSERELASVQS